MIWSVVITYGMTRSGGPLKQLPHVAQPLQELVDPVVWQTLRAAAAGDVVLDSVATMLYRGV